jgi:hypothetical protein
MLFRVQESPALEGYRNKCEFTIGFHPDTLKLTVGFRLGQPFLVSRRVFGSGSVLDPDSIRSVDPDPYSESGSGSESRRAKMTQKSRKKLRNFMV